MGNLPFRDLGRLMALTSATWALWAGLWGLFFRKFFWDMIDAELGPHGLIPPPTEATAFFEFITVSVPVVQILVMIFGVLTFCLEWPLGTVSDTRMGRSNIFRVVVYILFAAVEIIFYQGVDGAVYYLITSMVYLRAQMLNQHPPPSSRGLIEGKTDRRTYVQMV